MGKALVDAVIEDAVARQFGVVTLTTFRHVPSNAPFYQRLGFVELASEEAPSELARLFLAEVPDGSSVEARVLLIRNI